MTIIIRREFKPVIIIPASTFRAKMLRVTTAIDRPKERAILSKTFIFLKKTSVQAKPGSKKTSIKPRMALMAGKPSNICKNGDSKSKP